MRGGILLRGLLLLVVIAIVAGIGAYAYNAGVAQGLATPREGGTAVAPYGPVFYPRFGFGLGWLFCLLPLLLFFLFPMFGLWRGRRGWGGHGHRGEWDKNIPPQVAEWHRRMHESQPAEQPKES